MFIALCNFLYFTIQQLTNDSLRKVTNTRKFALVLKSYCCKVWLAKKQCQLYHQYFSRWWWW